MIIFFLQYADSVMLINNSHNLYKYKIYQAFMKRIQLNSLFPAIVLVALTLRATVLF